MTATQQFTDYHAVSANLNRSNPTIELDALHAGFVAPLTDLGLMTLSGADAVSFLQRQLTNDVEHMLATEARLAGYCTAQGRLLASFLTWKSGDDILLQLPRELLPAMQKRLQKFVLRDKVKISDVSDEYVLLGLGGAAAADTLAPWFAQLPAEPYGRVDSEHGTLIRVADAFDAPRYQWISSAETIGKAWSALTTRLKSLANNVWRLADIDAGIPQITSATQEMFVAQMVNFEIVGGVSFKKGCYPGQEVVARTQYLGKARRRMLAASIALPDSDVAAGTEVFFDDGPSQPCGTIVNAERSSREQIELLVSIRIPLPSGATVHHGSATGPLLHFKPLPYSLPDDSTRS
jgi:tRNA-modifying protein YgfZ